MILNNREFAITRAQLDRFEKTQLELASAPWPAGVDPFVVVLERQAIAGQIEDLRAQLAAYEAVRSGQQKAFSVQSLDELAAVLILARVAAGLTQRALAERLSIPEQQVQRYEKTRYASVSLHRLARVAAAIGVRVSIFATLQESERENGAEVGAEKAATFP